MKKKICHVPDVLLVSWTKRNVREKCASNFPGNFLTIKQGFRRDGLLITHILPFSIVIRALFFSLISSTLTGDSEFVSNFPSSVKIPKRTFSYTVAIWIEDENEADEDDIFASHDAQDVTFVFIYCVLN